MNTRPLLLSLVMAAVLAGSLPREAQAKPDKRERAEQREERPDKSRDRSHKHKGVLGRDEAARRAQRQYGGRVLSVDLLQSDEAPARYRVKLLSEGNVRTVDVDALED